MTSGSAACHGAGPASGPTPPLDPHLRRARSPSCPWAHPLVCRAPHRRWAMSLLLLLRRRMGREDHHWRPCRSTSAAASRLLDAPPLRACKCKAAACRRPHGGATRGRARHTACLRRVPLLDRHAATERPGVLPLFPPERRCGNRQAGAPASKAHLPLLLPPADVCSSPPCCSALPWHVPLGTAAVFTCCMLRAPMPSLCAQDGI